MISVYYLLFGGLLIHNQDPVKGRDLKLITMSGNQFATLLSEYWKFWQVAWTNSVGSLVLGFCLSWGKEPCSPVGQLHASDGTRQLRNTTDQTDRDTHPMKMEQEVPNSLLRLGISPSMAFSPHQVWKLIDGKGFGNVRICIRPTF